ncbi:MAG: SH3 domain-containing protein [Candidatus Methylomirabilales bacterium]
MASGADERNIAKLKLTLVEKETQIKELQQKYDDTVQEVVRAKAKLHSLESKAEAASTIAEAEIALKALRTAGHTDGPEVIQAEHLLQMSAQEFKKHNYGGALYLASQAKGLVNIGRGRLMGGEKIPMVSGEVLFALPLPLQVLAKSNVREGPGLDFEVLFTLEKGTRLFGHSHKDEWVRVKDKNGRDGWIYQTLVGER